MGRPDDLRLDERFAAPASIGGQKWPGGANGDTGWGSRALASKRQGNCILQAVAAMDVGAKANGPQESARGMRLVEAGISSMAWSTCFEGLVAASRAVRVALRVVQAVLGPGRGVVASGRG